MPRNRVFGYLKQYININATNVRTFKIRFLASLLTVTSARFIAQSAWAEWSQLRLFKAKEGRSYLQGSVCI
jgi:hypothetical protein